jgi:hypothetical protein
MILFLRCGAIGTNCVVQWYLFASGDLLAFQALSQTELGGDWNILPGQILAWAHAKQGVEGSKASGPLDRTVQKKKKGDDKDQHVATVLEGFRKVTIGGKEVHVIANDAVDKINITSPYATITVAEILKNPNAGLQEELDYLYSFAIVWAQKHYPQLVEADVLEVGRFCAGQMLLTIFKSGYHNPECTNETTETILDSAMRRKAKILLRLKHSPHFLSDLSTEDQKKVGEEFGLDFTELVIITVQVFKTFISEGLTVKTSFGLAPVVAEILHCACPDRKDWTPDVKDFITYLLLLSKMDNAIAKKEILGDKLSEARVAFCLLKPKKFQNFDSRVRNSLFANHLKKSAAPVVQANAQDEEFMNSAKTIYRKLKPKQIKGGASARV